MKNILFVILIFAVSCTSLKEVPGDGTPQKEVPAILFLNYKAFKTSDADIEIRLISTIPAQGKLKTDRQQPKDYGGQDLKYIQIDNASQRLDSGYIRNPLVKDVEYTDSDGGLVMKRMELDSGEFSIRIQKEPRARYISIEKAEQPGNQFLKTKL